jgi:hypothetical protein
VRNSEAETLRDPVIPGAGGSARGLVPRGVRTVPAGYVGRVGTVRLELKYSAAVLYDAKATNMRSARLTCALACAFAPIAFAQTPTVSGLLNNYSYTLPGLPNYGIAQGSIFDIFGD